MKPPFGGLVTACVSAFFALLIHCRGETASPENAIPTWFRSRLINSKFCAICEVSEASATHTAGTYKLVQLLRGHREDLPEIPAFIFLKDKTLGTRVLIVARHTPASTYYDYDPIENDAVRINVDQSRTDFDLPTIRVPLSRIALILEGV
ncbi:MAG TPA: hypothetical protein VGM54_08710 [Chthoniobacter sp.]|jgi:hypothetical protein